jgi:hypothetical protein
MVAYQLVKRLHGFKGLSGLREEKITYLAGDQTPPAFPVVRMSTESAIFPQFSLLLMNGK